MLFSFLDEPTTATSTTEEESSSSHQFRGDLGDQEEEMEIQKRLTESAFEETESPEEVEENNRKISASSDSSEGQRYIYLYL